MKIAVDGVLRPMSDERAIDLAFQSEPFRVFAERLAEKLVRENPSADPESFQIVRVVRGYWARAHQVEA